jgi:hypothetical protein
MLVGDLWKRHDSSNLLLHISVLTNVFFLAGLIYWFGPRWKYFGLANAIVLFVCSLVEAILYITDKHVIRVVLCVCFFLAGISRLKEEASKLKSLSEPQSDADQQQERGNF